MPTAAPGGLVVRPAAAPQSVQPSEGCRARVFLPEDPKAADVLAQRGQIAFDFGQFWLKGQRMGTGQANVKAYNRQLSRLIAQDKVKPSWIVSHTLPLADAARAYASFNAREAGWTKVVLKPGQ